MNETSETLEALAREMARFGANGWPNTVRDCAVAWKADRADRDALREAARDDKKQLKMALVLLDRMNHGYGNQLYVFQKDIVAILDWEGDASLPPEQHDPSGTS